MKSRLSAILMAVVLLLGPAVGVLDAANAVVSNTQVLNVNLTVGEQITLTVQSSANFASTGGGNYATSTIPVSTSWTLTSGRTQLDVCEFFTQGNLPGGPSQYGSQVNGAATQPFTTPGSSACAAQASVMVPAVGWTGPDVKDITITSGNLTGSDSSSIVVTASGISAPAGTYTGTVTFIAVAN